MSGTLYTFPNNFRANKILIAAQYSGHNVTVDPNFVTGETDKSLEFLKKFPFGKVPCYESGDVKLFQPNAIAYYVGNDQTRGGSNEAEVLQWIGFADNVILPIATTWVYPTQGIMQYNKQNREKAKNDLKTALTALNEYLATRTFLVGGRVSQADISLACTLSMLFENVLKPAFRKRFGNVTRWFVTLINQPQFKTVLGDVKLYEKMVQVDKKEKSGGGGGDSKSPKRKKEGEVQLAAAPAKNKDPWSVLPNTTYDMDALKRFYHNEGRDVSLKYFWDHFDKENYSIYQGTYKYNEQLTDMAFRFMMMNLIDGMFERLGSMSKQAFCNSLVLKKEGRYKIQSIWFWKGQDLAFKLFENWQHDTVDYDWVKLDPDSEVTKTKFKEFWTWEGNFDGWEFIDGSTFK